MIKQTLLLLKYQRQTNNSRYLHSYTVMQTVVSLLMLDIYCHIYLGEKPSND